MVASYFREHLDAQVDECLARGSVSQRLGIVEVCAASILAEDRRDRCVAIL